MTTMYLSSFKIGDKEYVELPNLDVTDLPTEIDYENKIVTIPGAEKVFIQDKAASIQIIVKPEHRDPSLNKALSLRDGDNNGQRLMGLYHSKFENSFGANFENDGVLTIDTSTISFNDMYSIELQLFRNNPEDPMAQPIEFVQYYLEVFLTAEPEPPTTTIPTIETEQFIKIKGKWFRMIQSGENGGGNDGGTVENNTWLEIFKVDNHNLLGMEKFDVTQSEFESYGDGSNEYATKPIDPLVKFINDLPTSFTIKIKEEYKHIDKYISFYNSAGHIIGTCRNEDFDENGLAVISKATIDAKNRVFENETIYIDLYFEASDVTETSGWVNYWIELIYDGEWTAPQSWLSEFKIGEVNALGLEGVQLMSDNTINIAAEIEYTEEMQFPGLTLAFKEDLLDYKITIVEYYRVYVNEANFSDISKLQGYFGIKSYPGGVDKLTIRISSGEEVQNYGVKFIPKA